MWKLFYIFLLLTFSFCNAGNIIKFEEDLECNFDEIVLEGKSENFPHIVGIVLEQKGDEILIETVRNKNFKRIIIKTKKKYKIHEEVELFILNNNKVCVREVLKL